MVRAAEKPNPRSQQSTILVQAFFVWFAYRTKYAYDYVGNRLYSNANRNGTDHIYAYGDLHRLKSSGRGNLPTTPADPPVLSRTADTHAWSLDALGNWTDFDLDFNGDGSFGTGDLQQCQ